MPFWKRLLMYLFGVGLGTLAVMFIFGDRDIGCSYFPNDRVLSDLRKKERQIPENIQAEMTTTGLDTSDIRAMLLSGNVDFDKSNHNPDSCKIYWIDLQREEEKSFSAEWRNCDSVITILSIQVKE